MFRGRVDRPYGGKIAEQQYGPPRLVFPHALQDVRLARNEAERAGVPEPSVSVVRDHRRRARLFGRDGTALGMLAAEEAGLGVEGSQADN